MTRRIRLMIVAGEASGDAHAAALVRAIRESQPDRDLEFFGATGMQMRGAGVESIVETDHLSVVGILEISRVLHRFHRAFNDLRAAAFERQPDAVILVDWPDFNLRLAKAFHRRGIHVIYYVSPQLWAWKQYRVRNIRRDVDLLLSILPFEKEWYSKRGIEKVEFVGHPLTDELHPRFDRAEFCRRHGLDLSRPIVSLLPGSRRNEIERILPPMAEAASLISRTRPEVQFVIPLAQNRSRTEADQILERLTSRGVRLPEVWRVCEGMAIEAMKAADAAAVASGTATLEAAIMGVPLVIVYKVSALNWRVLRPFIRVDHFGLINLIAGERIAAELIQHDFTGESLARELTSVLAEPANGQMRAKLRRATELLGAGGASRMAAQAVLAAIESWKAEPRLEGGWPAKTEPRGTA